MPRGTLLHDTCEEVCCPRLPWRAQVQRAKVQAPGQDASKSPRQDPAPAPTSGARSRRQTQLQGSDVSRVHPGPGRCAQQLFVSCCL